MTTGRTPSASATVTPRRLAEAVAEEDALTQFCAQYQLTLDATAVVMYLTSLQDSAAGISGRGVRTRIARLDLAARVGGARPWTSNPDVRRYINGLHHDLPLAERPRADPLYRENVNALMQATRALTHEQVRDVAAVLVAHDTGLPAQALAALRWDAVHLTRRTAVIDQPGFAVRTRLRGPPLYLSCRSPHTDCTVHALHRLRRLTGTRTGLVFASPWGGTDRVRLAMILRPLLGHPCREAVTGRCGGVSNVVADLRRSTPTQARDQALIALSFVAALRAREAIALHSDHVRLEQSGLLLLVPGRREPTWIGADEDVLGAVDAWTEWLDVRAAQACHTDLAFPQVSGTRIWDRPMGPQGLNYLVQERADEAVLVGTYTFTSLRVGCIRTMLRAGLQAHIVAGRADLRSLSSVARHSTRENLLRNNVAARLGL